MPMRALQSFVYDGRLLKAGDVFEQAEGLDQGRSAVHHFLTSAGLAEDVASAPPGEKPKRGRYKRRDLRADDE